MKKISLILFLIPSLLFAGGSSLKSFAPKYEATPNAPVIIKQKEAVVVRALFATDIDNGQPRDSIDRLGNAYKLIYFFTEIKGYNGPIFHRWFYEDELLNSYKTRTTKRGYNVSRQRLDPNKTGMYYVAVVDDEGKVLIKRRFKYYKVVRKEIYQAPIQEQVQIRNMDKCEKELERYHELNKEHPDDPYYKFMLRKWAKRCGIE